jgi:hypothetical protein
MVSAKIELRRGNTRRIKMKVRYSVLATALLATVCTATVARSEGAPTGQNMQNNSGTKTPDEQDTNKRSMAPNAGQPAGSMTRTTGSGMGATNTNSGTKTPDEQDTSQHKTPGGAMKAAPNPSR